MVPAGEKVVKATIAQNGPQVEFLELTTDKGTKLALGLASSSGPRIQVDAAAANSSASLRGFSGGTAYPGGPLVSLVPSYKVACSALPRVGFDSTNDGMFVVLLRGFYDDNTGIIVGLEQTLNDGTVFTIGLQQGSLQCEWLLAQ